MVKQKNENELSLHRNLERSLPLLAVITKKAKVARYLNGNPFHILNIHNDVLCVKASKSPLGLILSKLLYQKVK